jgi:hypothetical protein
MGIAGGCRAKRPESRPRCLSQSRPVDGHSGQTRAFHALFSAAAWRESSGGAARPAARLAPVRVGRRWELPGRVGVQWELPGAISPRRCGPVLRFSRFRPARLAFCPDGGYPWVLSGTVDSAVPGSLSEEACSRHHPHRPRVSTWARRDSHCAPTPPGAFAASGPRHQREPAEERRSPSSRASRREAPPGAPPPRAKRE